MPSNTEIWCVSGLLNKQKVQAAEQEIEHIADKLQVMPPSLSCFEEDDDTPWRIDIFFVGKPDPLFIPMLQKALDISRWDLTSNPVKNQDWVSQSQKILAPIEAGRFFIFGSHDANRARDFGVNIQIDAGQAFGTGRHETTWSCLKILDEQANTLQPKHILDLGTGSGLLAMAAQSLWPKASVLASDIDPVAAEVAVENIKLNNYTLRSIAANGPGIAAITADGLDDPTFAKEGPFDLIIANILAGPLIDLAPDITRATASKGRVILSGLLIIQQKEVLCAYEARGLVLEGRMEKGEWLALLLRKP